MRYTMRVMMVDVRNDAGRKVIQHPINISVEGDSALMAVSFFEQAFQIAINAAAKELVGKSNG